MLLAGEDRARELRGFRGFRADPDKAECVDDEGHWHTIEALELATLFWVDWYNTTRLHSSIDYLTPVANEHAYSQQQTSETQTV